MPGFELINGNQEKKAVNKVFSEEQFFLLMAFKNYEKNTMLESLKL